MSGAGTLLRLALALALVLGLAATLSRGLVQHALPALHSALQWSAPDFEVLEVGIVSDPRGTQVAAAARLGRSLILGGRAIVPDGQGLMVATATLGSTMLAPWTALLLVLAWPGAAAESLLRLPLLVPLLLPVLWLDTPATLAAWLWQAQLRQHDPGAFSSLVAWSTFLNGGGRLVLGGLAGLGAVMLARLAIAAMARGAPGPASPSRQAAPDRRPPSR